MKKTIKQFARLFILINLALLLSHTAIAETYYSTICWIWETDCITVATQEEADRENQKLKDLRGETATQDGTSIPGPPAIPTPAQRVSQIGGEGQYGLPSFNVGQHPDSPPDYEHPGVGAISSPIYFALDFLRYLLSGIALIVIVYMAIKLIMSSDEDGMRKTTKGFEAAIYGFVIIQIADFLVRQVFFGDYGEAFEDVPTTKEYAERGTELLRGIAGLIHLFLAAIAVLVIVVRGVKLLTSGGSEEELTTAKSHIIYAVLGLFIVGLSDLVIRGFIFPDEGSRLPDVDTGKQIIIMITNYISGFIAIIAFVVLFYGGYRYVVSAGSDEAKETFKKIAISVALALLLALGAFAAVNTIVKLDNPSATEFSETQQP